MGSGTRKICILLVFFLGCLTVPESMVFPVLAAQEGTFTGTWDANGSQEVLAFGNGREAASPEQLLAARALRKA